MKRKIVVEIDCGDMHCGECGGYWYNDGPICQHFGADEWDCVSLCKPQRHPKCLQAEKEARR